MIRPALVSPVGFLIGLSLGALGGGGAIVTVPLLVYGVGMDVVAATTASLLVVGPVAAWGAVSHWRSGRVRVRAGAIFGLVGLVGSATGSQLSYIADPRLLMLAFSGLMAFAAAATFRRAQSGVGAPAEGGPARGILRLVLAGSTVGFVTGLFGVGGGFVVVPALVLALGLSVPEAVGTSLLVVAINSAVALAPRLGAGESLPWAVVLPLLLTGLVGAGVGNRVAGRVEPGRLAAWFATLILCLAAGTAAVSLASLL